MERQRRGRWRSGDRGETRRRIAGAALPLRIDQVAIAAPGLREPLTFRGITRFGLRSGVARHSASSQQRGRTGKRVRISVSPVPDNACLAAQVVRC